jgi:hypothetical protein
MSPSSTARIVSRRALSRAWLAGGEAVTEEAAYVVGT